MPECNFVRVSVSPTIPPMGSDALARAWLDLDGDGKWEADEEVRVNMDVYVGDRFTAAREDASFRVNYLMPRGDRFKLKVVCDGAVVYRTSYTIENARDWIAGGMTFKK